MEDFDFLLENQIDLLTEQVMSLDTVNKYILINASDLSEASITDIKMKAKMAKKKVANSVNKVDNSANIFLKNLKEKIRNRNRDDIVEGNLPKLSSIIKGAIATGVGATISPGLTAIGILTTYAISKHTKRQEKIRILSELERELEITKEKISDAESSGDKKKKYELIRIRQKLETDIDRIKNYIE